MALDGKLLSRAKAALEEKRRRSEERYERRLEKVYAKAPLIRALDDEIRATMAQLVGVALGSEDSERVEDIRLINLDLQEQRRAAIKRAGFPEDYLNDESMCSVCNDTGYTRNEICGCLLELYKDEQRKSLSNLLKLGEETFDSFDLSYYDDEHSPDMGKSPRRNMEIIYEMCVEYARKFGKNSVNLFFIGEPGLGKTFLSACIARVVAENGHSVVYDMASFVFAKFEDAKFTRTEGIDEVRAEIKRYLECDLLIMDDLGTEMTTAFTVSALYELINTRLVTGKKTLISSNLSLQELQRRYTKQIMSRLEGDYEVLTFCGEDVRKKRNSV